MDKPFFSIIIPVYNGMTHDFPKCLNSIWLQSLPKGMCEVICVDDCSTDGTREWIKSQQLLHDNLFLIENSKNLKQGGTRNNGVKVSQGEYVFFIDSDDYYHCGSLLKIYEILKKDKLDILVADSAFEFKGYEHNNLQLNFKINGVLSGEEFIQQTGGAWAPWRCIINRDYYVSHDFKFEENTSREDIDWATRLFFYAKRVKYVPILLVHYVKSTDSTTDSMYKTIPILIDGIVAGNRTIDVANTLYANSKVKRSILKLGCSYRYESIKSLFGLWISISEKKRILSYAGQVQETDSALTRYAITHPLLYVLISNIAVPFYRIARKFHRYNLAKRFKHG